MVCFSNCRKRQNVTSNIGRVGIVLVLGQRGCLGNHQISSFDGKNGMKYVGIIRLGFHLTYTPLTSINPLRTHDIRNIIIIYYLMIPTG